MINGYGTPDDPEWEHPATQDEPHRWCTLASGQQKPYRVNSDGVLRDGLTANQTKFFGRQAQDWMLARATDAKPWFCYFALADPHAPHEPTVAYEHTHDSERLVSPGTKEADLSDKSGWTLGQGVAPPTPGRTTGRARWRSSRGCASGALRSSTRWRRPASWTTPW